MTDQRVINSVVADIKAEYVRKRARAAARKFDPYQHALQKGLIKTKPTQKQIKATRDFLQPRRNLAWTR